MEGRPEKLTFDAGLMLLRELDEKLDVTRSLASKLIDERAPQRIQYSLSQMLRMTPYAMAIGSAHSSAAAGRRDDAVFHGVPHRGDEALHRRTRLQNEPDEGALRAAMGETSSPRLRP
ncbi:hypothetical protein Poly30_13180 [Planctomycetes bacterium Poly30]|uniref:Transposase DDE domain-containing protein n=1 Tax=Saltatorellus ferox TaxID=2528018 RepID=A0A518EP09_9BACT|nr:hypothetical protein Poly30_13180 [Planctomycetes bacterium Poly30]